MMDAAITIEGFNALLKSEQQDNSLLETLRQLTKIELPEKVRALKAETMAGWMGWGW